MRKYEKSKAWVMGARYPYLKKVKERWGDLLDKYASLYELDAELLYSVVSHESGGNERAVSPAGAQGLMQIMPGTAKGLGLSDPFDPEKNIEAGARYLKGLIDRYDGNIAYALAAYNWGPGNLKKNNYRVLENSETQRYLYNILGITQTDQYEPKRRYDPKIDWTIVNSFFVDEPGFSSAGNHAPIPTQLQNNLFGHPIERAFPQLKIEPWSIKFEGGYWRATYVDPVTALPKGELQLYHDQNGRVWYKQIELGVMPRESIAPNLAPVDIYNLARGFQYQPPQLPEPKERIGLIDPIGPPFLEPIDWIVLL